MVGFFPSFFRALCQRKKKELNQICNKHNDSEDDDGDDPWGAGATTGGALNGKRKIEFRPFPEDSPRHPI